MYVYLLTINQYKDISHQDIYLIRYMYIYKLDIYIYIIHINTQGELKNLNQMQKYFLLYT